MRRTLIALSLVLLAACGSGSGGTANDPKTSSPAATATESTSSTSASEGGTVTFTAEVWADNWFSLYVNGELVGEDSVPITTERSFNAETITFTATYPLTIAMVTKDYKENDSGLEYIGTDRQQIGDGGFIAQFTDTSTGKVVASTSADWRGLVIHRAPLNEDCVSSANPIADCQHEIVAEPEGWTAPGFDDGSWTAGTEYTEAEVGTKDGYDTIRWSPAARLIWSSSLKIDNTVLWRTTVPAS